MASPKDQNLVNQAINGFDILLSTEKEVVRRGGTIILLGACEEGQGFDRCHDHFMKLTDYGEYREAVEGRQMMVYSPNVSLLSVRQCITKDCLLFQEWGALVQTLSDRYGSDARVAVFPCATMQVEEA